MGDLASFVVLLGWWPLRQRPGVGTVANAVLVGAVIDLVLSLFHPSQAVWARVALHAGGVAGHDSPPVLQRLGARSRCATA